MRSLMYNKMSRTVVAPCDAKRSACSPHQKDLRQTVGLCGSECQNNWPGLTNLIIGRMLRPLV